MIRHNPKHSDAMRTQEASQSESERVTPSIRFSYQSSEGGGACKHRLENLINQVIHQKVTTSVGTLLQF